MHILHKSVYCGELIRKKGLEETIISHGFFVTIILRMCKLRTTLFIGKPLSFVPQYQKIYQKELCSMNNSFHTSGTCLRLVGEEICCLYRKEYL